MTGAITRIDDHTFEVAGLRFELTQDPARTTSSASVVLMKSPSMLSLYDDLINRLLPRNVLEFGIFEGGSALYFGATKDFDRYVGIDLRPRSEVVFAQMEKAGLNRKVRLHYGVSQADTAAVNRIIRKEFDEKPLDLIIDDASHLLGPSRVAFEETFPRLRPGGVYVLEDWGWAHWEGGTFQEPSGQWNDQPALTTLVFELTMAMASNPRIISKIEIGSASWMFVTRGHGPVPENFSLASVIRNRNRPLPSI